MRSAHAEQIGVTAGLPQTWHTGRDLCEFLLLVLLAMAIPSVLMEIPPMIVSTN
jgi:hypothetical protein